jgi:hypothetical protein
MLQKARKMVAHKRRKKLLLKPLKKHQFKPSNHLLNLK